MITAKEARDIAMKHSKLDVLLDDYKIEEKIQKAASQRRTQLSIKLKGENANDDYKTLKPYLESLGYGCISFEDIYSDLCIDIRG